MTGQFDYLHEVGTLRDVVFHIGVRADHNTEHRKGTIHIDRYYREEGADEKDFTLDVDEIWDADTYLEDNWQHFARTYLDNHGKSR